MDVDLADLITENAVKFGKQFPFKYHARDYVIGKILTIGEILNEEAEFILREELREPRIYFSILRAISFGNTKFSNIMNYTGLDRNSMTRYLDILKTLGFICRDIPITEKSPEKRKNNYR